MEKPNKYFIFLVFCAVVSTGYLAQTHSVNAQAPDYNPDGTPTLRTQCLQSPGLCDGAPLGAYSSALDDAIGSYIGILLKKGWDLRRQELALQNEYNEADITFDRSRVDHLVGQWRGAYVCRQGKTGMTLTLDYLSDRSIQGVAKFYPIRSGSSKAAKGSYSVRVLVGHTHIFIEPLEWIKKPSGYTMAGMSGLVFDDGNSFAGEVQLKGCGNFAFARLR